MEENLRSSAILGASGVSFSPSEARFIVTRHKRLGFSGNYQFLEAGWSSTCRTNCASLPME